MVKARFIFMHENNEITAHCIHTAGHLLVMKTWTVTASKTNFRKHDCTAKSRKIGLDEL